VALTRAKYALWMVGHEATLRKDADFSKLIQGFQEKQRIMTTEFLLKAPEVGADGLVQHNESRASCTTIIIMLPIILITRIRSLPLPPS
jgi:hypothetical protein